jgi:hypothetical protein
LVVDDREELRDFVHTCLCFGSPQQPRKQIAGY